MKLARLPRFALISTLIACPFIVKASMAGLGTIQSQGPFYPGHLAIEAHGAYDRILLDGVVSHQNRDTKKGDFERRTYSRILAQGILIIDEHGTHFTAPMISKGQINAGAIAEKIANDKKRLASVLAKIMGSAIADYNRAHPSQRISNYIAPSLSERLATGKSTGYPELDSSLKKELDKNTVVAAFKFADEKLNAAMKMAEEMTTKGVRVQSEGDLNNQVLAPFFEALFEGLEVSDATRNLSQDGDAMSAEAHFIGQMRPAFTIRLGADASNLGFAIGGDMSKADPIGSLVWSRPADISKFDTRNYNGMMNGALPPEITGEGTVSVTYWKPGHHGRTPKIYVKGPDGKPYKMKISLPTDGATTRNTIIGAFQAWFTNGNEVHTQTAANNLAAALGFNVYPTFYKQNVRMYFEGDGAGTPQHDVLFNEARKKALEELMANQNGDSATSTHHNFTVELADDRVQTDEAGRKYVLIPEGAFAARWTTKTIFSAGPFERSSFNKELFRDHRALGLFAALVADGDTKADNTDVMLVRGTDGKLHMAYTPTDMGATFGWSMGKEQVNLYTWDFFNHQKSIKDCAHPENARLVSTFHTARKTPIFDASNLNDARWFARLVGQLTREQIVNAFATAGYPSPVKETLAEKFMKRRDDLVEYTCADDVVPQRLSRVVSDQDKRNFTVAGFEDYFKDGEIIKAPPGLDRRATFVFSGGGKDNAGHDFRVGMTNNTERIGINSGETVLEKIQVFGNGTMVGDFKARSGIVQLIPQIYFVPNGQDTKNPFLRVEVYRFGIGSKPKDNVSVPELVHPAVTLEVAYVKELIKVRPVQTKDVNGLEAIKFNIKLQNMVVPAVRGITQDLVNSMQPGDALISSGYISTGGVFNTKPGLFALGPDAASGITFANVHEVALVKTANEIVANWSKINDEKIQAEAGIRLAWLRMNAFEFKAERKTRNDHTFAFNLSNKGQMEQLLENLHSNLPRFADEKVLKSLGDAAPAAKLNRETTRRLVTSVFSLFGLATRSGSKADMKIVEKAQNGSVDKKMLEIVRQRRKRSFFLGGGNLLHDDVITRARKIDTRDTSNISLSFEFSYDRTYATIKNYAKLYDEALTVMPAQLQAYTPDQMNMNPLLGELKFSGMVQFTTSALSDIFGIQRTKEQVCGAFYDHLPFSMLHNGTPWSAQEWCAALMPKGRAITVDDFMREHSVRPSTKINEIRSAVIETLSFVDSYIEAQKNWAKLKSDPHATLKALERLASGGLIRMRVETLESFVNKGTVIREGELSSNLEAFAGGEGEISIPAQDQHDQLVAQEGDPMTTTIIDALLIRLKPFRYDAFRVDARRSGLRVDLHSAPTTEGQTLQ